MHDPLLWTPNHSCQYQQSGKNSTATREGCNPCSIHLILKYCCFQTLSWGLPWEFCTFPPTLYIHLWNPGFLMSQREVPRDTGLLVLKSGSSRVNRLVGNPSTVSTKKCCKILLKMWNLEGIAPEITYQTLLSLLERMVELMRKHSDEHTLHLKRCYQYNGRERVWNFSPAVR